MWKPWGQTEATSSALPTICRPTPPCQTSRRSLPPTGSSHDKDSCGHPTKDAKVTGLRVDGVDSLIMTVETQATPTGPKDQLVFDERFEIEL